MRKTVGLVSSGTLLVVGYMLASLPTSGGTLLSTIHNGITQNDSWMFSLVIFGAVASIILFVLAIQKVRFVVQEHRLEDIDRYLRQIIPLIERLERHHNIAKGIKELAAALEPRIAALVSVSTGIGATFRQIAEIEHDARQRLSGITNDGEGNDIILLSHDLGERVTRTDRRLTELAAAFAQVAELRGKVSGFIKQVEDLEEKGDQAVEDIASISEDLDEILSDDGDEGRLYELELGNDDQSDIGGLNEQVDNIADRVKTIGDRLDTLKTQVARLPELAISVKAILLGVEILEDSNDGVVAQVEALFEALDKLLDSNNDGIIADIEAGESSRDGDLDDQLGELQERIADIMNRLSALHKSLGRIDRIRDQFAAMMAVLSK